MNIELASITEALRQNSHQVVSFWEERYRTQVEEIAQKVFARRTESPVVLLAGPSGSSKTTTGHRLRERLEAMGVPAHLISMDNYFLSWEEPSFPKTPEGQRDLEAPGCLNIPLLNRHFSRLETGEDIQVPIYDFPTHRPLEDQFIHMSPARGDIFIFEGIHALNPLFTTQHPGAFRLYISPVSSFVAQGKEVCSPQILRLMRRITRDSLFRGASAEFSLGLWGNVVHSEKIYITPYQASAHAAIDTTLGYEPMALKDYVLPLLKQLPPSVPCRAQVDEAIGVLEAVDSIPAALVPENSILREFIG